MALQDCFERLKSIDQLIRFQKTGTPIEFAKKLNISRSTLFEYLNILKDMNAPIIYNDIQKTYIYTRKCKFEFGYLFFDLTDNELKEIDGGVFFKKKLFFFQQSDNIRLMKHIFAPEFRNILSTGCEFFITLKIKFQNEKFKFRKLQCC